ncbi:MAG: hypothetical protein J5884_06065 [Paludibacteraceae bacterium]|nr:hypothetical protein [Paludibacteraceae bacterium]
MKKFFILLFALVTASTAFARVKVNQGSFNVLKGERFVGTTLDFSQAKFDGRDLEAHLYSMNISQSEWKAFEKSCCIAINMAYAYKMHENLTLGLREAKKTKYYILIQPLEIDMNDGECDVEIYLKDAATNETLVIAQGDSKAKESEVMQSFMRNFEDRSFWEYNILHSMAVIGMDVMSSLLDF